MAAFKPLPSTHRPFLPGCPSPASAYLDRPKEAGYFLFPDLSVRHEGRYRFNFNLYEETKEDKDKSEDAAPPTEDLGPAAGGSFDWVMEVKSQDFLVYSAKKFPGLTEVPRLAGLWPSKAAVSAFDVTSA